MDDLQDIARSSYADMLNDDERNKAFDAAIKVCVNHLIQNDRDKFFNCCDIGTGSGLLSMMIVRAFRSLGYTKFHIDAYEAFKPMAECAKEVISGNNMSEYITVISKRSDQADGHPKYDLLVAELLDTELIGEGCIGFYQHAIKSLCAPNCLFIPHLATIYIEPIASYCLFKRQSLIDMEFRQSDMVTCIKVSDSIKYCCGLSEIDDMQASALREGVDFERVTDPQLAFQFQFNDLEKLQLYEQRKYTFELNEDLRQPLVVVMWWTIDMYDAKLMKSDYFQDNVDKSFRILSCAPTWARSDELLARDELIETTYQRQVWREHWIQGIYHMASVHENLNLIGSKKLSSFNLYGSHDSHSMRFDLKNCDTKLPPSCTCGVHRLLSRTQLSFLNDRYQLGKLIGSCLKDNEVTCDVIGKLDFDLKRAEDNSTGSVGQWAIKFIDNNGACLAELTDPSLQAELPWKCIVTRQSAGLSSNPIASWSIKSAEISFRNLNRIRTSIGTCEGFDLTHLDELINQSSGLVDESIESHHLWEYESHCVSTERRLFTSEDVDANVVDFDIAVDDSIKLEKYKGWALVFWSELSLAATGEIISTGPIHHLEKGQLIQWNRHCMQHVHFLHHLADTLRPGEKIKVKVEFNRLSGNLQVTSCRHSGKE